MSAFLETIVPWLVDYLAVATVLLTAALSLRLVLGQPAARMAVAWSACLGLVALAVLTALPRWPRVGLGEHAQRWSASVAPMELIELDLTGPEASLPLDVAPLAANLEPLTVEPVDIAAAQLVTPNAFLASAMPEPADWTQVAAGVWLVSAMGAAAWILAGWIRTKHLMHTAARAPGWVVEALRTIVKSRLMPDLFTSRRINSAVALGALAPKIVLPEESVKEANQAAVQAALAHEWAHIRHGDLWLLAIERLLLPLLAMHPLFWWLRRSIRLDQELLADAAAAGDEPAEYAEALLVLARTAQPARHGLPALSMWEHPSTLSRRVAMILDPKSRAARPLGRAWTAVTVALALPAILALSAVSLRPTTAQEKPAEAPQPSTRPDSESPPPIPRSSGQSVPVTQVHMELLVMSVNRDKLAAADTTLEDAIAEATESRCRKEAGLVVAEIKPDEVVKLLDGLKKHNAVEVISRPSVITLDGREANVHVGGEAPVLLVEETINGKHEQRVEFKEFGTILMVRPKLSKEKPDLVTLDILAEQASLVPPGEKAVDGAVPRDVPGLVSHKFKLNSDVKLGGSLLVAESPADKKQLRDAVKQQFLLIVTPHRAVRTVAAVYADPAAGDKGEAARAATESALDKATAAATAAEPESGAVAPSVLQAEHDARAKETADLKRQIELLQKEVERLQVVTGTKIVSRNYQIQHRKAADVSDDVKVLLSESPVKGDLQLTVNERLNSILVQVPEKHADEFGKTVEALDRASPAATDESKPPDERVQAIWRALAQRRSRLAVAAPKLRQLDFWPKLGTAEYVSQELQKLIGGPKAAEKLGLQVTIDPVTNRLTVLVREEFVADVEKAVAALEPSAKEPPAKATQQPHPTAAEPAASVHAQRANWANWGVLTADVAEARLELERAEKAFARAEQLKGTNAISELQLESMRFELEKAKIQLQRAEAKLYAPALAATSPAAPERSNVSRQTEVKLLELDLAEAKLAVEDAEARLDHAEEIRKRSPGTLSDQELRTHRLGLERAKIQMQRIMIKLEATKTGEATRR